ncbi:interleukin-1 receptor type 1-like isoform 2-T2 [Pholidichthys leucotaenia]
MAGCLFPTLLVSMVFVVAHGHKEEPDTYHVSTGYLFILRCYRNRSTLNVTWHREGSGNLSLPTGVEVREGMLWFLPVQMSHNGTYICEKRKAVQSFRFQVSVSSGACPDTYENKSFPVSVSSILPCNQNEIFRLNTTKNVRWMKDCSPLSIPELTSVDEQGNMRIHSPSKANDGTYTCLVDISLDGRNYTGARSIRLTVNNGVQPFWKPEVLVPNNTVMPVDIGQSVKLKCYAYVGVSEDEETIMNWTVDEVHIDEYEQLSASLEYVHDGGKVYAESILSISEVLEKFINVPFQCFITNPHEQSIGVAWLQKADHSVHYMMIGLSLSFVTVLVVVACCGFFKVEVVLAYRKLLRHFSKQQSRDGKLYDAYVSILHTDTQSLNDMECFAKKILPEELEKKHAYSLYIRGRDDCPGEAMHDAVSAMLGQCCRLIIILPSDSTTQEALLRDNQYQLCYEQLVGLYDALTRNNPRVILLEYGGPVNYSRLPESLRYIEKKQGALKWKKDSTETNKLTKNFLSNRNFWKNLRYHMPSVPVRGHQTVV